MTAPVVRDLRPTDISCACGAIPGQLCKEMLVEGQARRWFRDGTGAGMFHAARFREFEKLVAAGWQWQEVDPTDIGAVDRRRPGACEFCTKQAWCKKIVGHDGDCRIEA